MQNRTNMRRHPVPIRMAIIKKAKDNVSVRVEKLEPLHTLLVEM